MYGLRGSHRNPKERKEENKPSQTRSKAKKLSCEIGTCYLNMHVNSNSMPNLGTYFDAV